MVTSDLRRDLAHMALIKTWPVRGASLVRGELAAPAVVLSTFASVAIFVAWVFALQLPSSVIDWSWTELTGTGVAALLLAPLVILLQLLFHNALAVMFPAWVVATGPRAAGVEVIGQRMVMLAALFLCLAIALAPAVLAGGLTAYVVRPFGGALWLPVGAAVAAVVLAVECAFASEAIGAVMDRTDISVFDRVRRVRRVYRHTGASGIGCGRSLGTTGTAGAWPRVLALPTQRANDGWMSTGTALSLSSTRCTSGRTDTRRSSIALAPA